ncbi:MAG: MATE family efflux transporter [Oscillospiraceae bacterium]|nr:MATE family efflux transporter [Oscillospiraceae bacterium]
MITDMTVGKPSRVLWKFCLPLLISVAFQQFYNIADSVIAGNFIADGENAIAAIGASYPVTMLFMAFAVGYNSGCSVICSNLFGSHKFSRLRTSIWTSVISSAILSLILTVIGIVFLADIAALLNTPAEIFDDACVYLNIYVYGVPFLFLYNVCTGIFSALGDSKTPLYFLIGSSVGNVILDIVMVSMFGMGVDGVAWATFIAQGCAAVLAFVTLVIRIRKIDTDNEEVQLFSWELLGKISAISIPSILQQSFVSVGNLFIQGIVNGYDSAAVIAGYSSAIKLNTFVVTCVSTMSNGMASFTAQNVGAGKMKRISEGFRSSVIMSALISIPITVIYLIFGENLIYMFMKEPDAAAVAVGCNFLNIVAPFYFAVTAKLNCDAVLKGAGAVKYFVITTFTDLILRVVLAFIFSDMFGVEGVWWCWPIGWVVSAAMSVVFYAVGHWKKHITAM